MDVKVQMRISSTTTPSLSIGTTKDYVLKFPVELATSDDVNFIITTSSFTFNNKKCNIKNLLNSETLQIISSDGIEVDNIGSYEPSTGTVTLSGFNPSAVDGSIIKVSATPANQGTIRPLLNYILDVDTSLSTVTSTTDFENIRISL
jgi:hypothetical protein